MSSLESQERMKEEAKGIRTRLDALIRDTDPKVRITRMTCIYAGLLTETLLDYEEPDVVMEQAFHRIADLLKAEPDPPDDTGSIVPLAYIIDNDTEIGRHLARSVAERLPKGMDDLHEIAIALIIDDFPQWEKNAYSLEELMTLLVETVIAALTYEMATQDFCDILIEDFMAEGENGAGEAIMALSALAGYYFSIAQHKMPLPGDAEQMLTHVMVRESLRHGTPGLKDWAALAAANDGVTMEIPSFIKDLKPVVEEFFVLIGLDNPLARAVSVAKAVGRMVAVITVEDVGQIHPSIAKSLAKTGMILGMKYDEAKA
jgi:hypothetical protein